MRGLTDDRVRDQVEPEILDHLAIKDPAGAVDFARALPAGSRRDTALSIVAARLKAADAPLLASLAAEIPLDVGNTRLFNVYDTWMGFDASAAMRDIFSKLESNPFESAEKQPIEEMLNLLWRFHSKESAAALAKVPDSSENALRDRFLTDASARIGSEDSVKARSWVETLPPGAAREAAFQGIAIGWARSAANAAAEWLQGLPAGPDRTAAITGFVGATFDKDPAGAMSWVRSIPDPDAGESALSNAWQRWAARTRASAEQWRDTTPELTPTHRVRLK